MLVHEGRFGTSRTGVDRYCCTAVLIELYVEEAESNCDEEVVSQARYIWCRHIIYDYITLLLIFTHTKAVSSILAASKHFRG